MAETLKHLRKRVRSVKSNKQITKAMEMVSANKLRKTEALLKPAVELQEYLMNLLLSVSSDSSESSHLLFQAPKNSKKYLFVVFASDRGLCGPFNNAIIDFAHEKIVTFIHEKKLSHDDVEMILVGKKSRSLIKIFSKESPLKVRAELVDFAGKVDSEKLSLLSKAIEESYLSGESREIYLIHYSTKKESRYRPIQVRLLPFDIGTLQKSTVKMSSVDYIFEPNREMILNKLLLQYIDIFTYVTMLEQFCSEHRSRMINMNKATKNCEELTTTLTLKINKARQSAITKELLDIVSGAEAIK